MDERKKTEDPNKLLVEEWVAGKEGNVRAPRHINFKDT